MKIIKFLTIIYTVLYLNSSIFTTHPIPSVPLPLPPSPVVQNPNKPAVSTPTTNAPKQNIPVVSSPLKPSLPVTPKTIASPTPLTTSPLPKKTTTQVVSPLPDPPKPRSIKISNEQEDTTKREVKKNVSERIIKKRNKRKKVNTNGKKQITLKEINELDIDKLITAEFDEKNNLSQAEGRSFDKKVKAYEARVWWVQWHKSNKQLKLLPKYVAKDFKKWIKEIIEKNWANVYIDA